MLKQNVIFGVLYYKGGVLREKIMFAILCITISLLTFIGCDRISYDAYEELVRNSKTWVIQ